MPLTHKNSKSPTELNPSQFFSHPKNTKKRKINHRIFPIQKRLKRRRRKNKTRWTSFSSSCFWFLNYLLLFFECNFRKKEYYLKENQILKPLGNRFFVQKQHNRSLPRVVEFYRPFPKYITIRKCYQITFWWNNYKQ